MPNTKKVGQDAINDNDKGALHDAGVDISGLSTEGEETIVDIDGGTPPVTDLSDTGIRFVDDNKKIGKEDLSSLAEAKMKSQAGSGSDLEAEFKSELGGLDKAPSDDPVKFVAEKMGSMSALLDKIRQKLGLKKNKVKEELSSLKKMKEGISKDIADIKELEESEDKIEGQLGKIESIKAEMDAIEKEVGEELKS